MRRVVRYLHLFVRHPGNSFVFGITQSYQMDVVSSYLAKRRNQLGIECFEGVSEISVLTSVEMPHTKESVRGLTIFPLCIHAPFRGSAQVLVTKRYSVSFKANLFEKLGSFIRDQIGRTYSGFSSSFNLRVPYRVRLQDLPTNTHADY